MASNGGGGRRDRSRSRDRSRGRSRSDSHRRRAGGRRSRDRSRSRTRSISRSVSRELYDREPELRHVRDLVEQHQEHIVGRLADHKTRIEEKLQLRTRRFGNRQLEKQYQVNLEFKELAEKVVDALSKRELERGELVAGQLLEKIELHEQDLIIADTSPHGWLAVAKVRSNTELPKHVRKKLEQVNKDLAARRTFRQDGFAKKKPFQFSGQGREPVVGRAGGGGRRLSPEELLFQATKQTRTGSCVHCGKGQHFYKECPDFWRKVIESREAKAKADQSN